MSSVETTELKLRTTPTGGVEASHSPYYRRLLSAGYKGFLQGTIGGGSLYGAMGLVIGGLVALAAAPAVGAVAFFLIPAVGAAGVLKGASTFGNIGSVAAINAESADLSEQRRYLLDRYYDLPEGPAGDKEAEVIKKELIRQHDNGPAPSFFHWKTVAIGAAIGLGIGLVAMSPAVLGILAAHTTGAAATAGAQGFFAAALSGLTKALATAAPATVGAICAGVGALTGATIGIDRYYIRKWFDKTEGTVHSTDHSKSALIERSEQIERLKTAARADDKTKQHLLQLSGGTENYATPIAENVAAILPASVASLDKPDTKISAATYEKRLADIQKAMEVPAL